MIKKMNTHTGMLKKILHIHEIFYSNANEREISNRFFTICLLRAYTTNDVLHYHIPSVSYFKNIKIHLIY